MQKRGQVTVFILLGMLILGAIGGMILFSKNNQMKDLIIERSYLGIDTNPIQSFVESCMQKVGKEGLRDLGRNGGYYFNDEPAERFYFDLISFSDINDTLAQPEFFATPYYFYEGKDYFPSLKKLQEEYREYLLEGVPKCLGNYSHFHKEGLIINPGKMNFQPQFRSKGVEIQLVMPLEIKQIHTEARLSYFSQQINFDFLSKYDLLNQIREEQKKDVSSIPLGFLSNLAYHNDFSYETINYEESGIVQFSFLFNDTLSGSPFNFVYLSKYDWSEVDLINESFLPEINLQGEMQTQFLETEFITLGNGPEDIQTKDYNKMEPLDLYLSLDRGEVTNLKSIHNANFMKVLNQYPALMKKGKIFSEFNRRLKGNIKFLNNNAKIKKAWFAENDLGCHQCKLESFDGKNIVTQGAKVKFDINNPKFRLADILQNGAVRLRDETTTISNVGKKQVEMSTAKDGSIVIKNGKIDIKTTELISIKTENSVISTAYGIVKSDKPLSVTIKDQAINIKGQKVTVSNPNTKEIEIVFSGEITYNKNYPKTKQLTIGKGSSLSFYQAKQVDWQLKVSKKTEFYNSLYGCSLESGSCIDLVDSRKGTKIPKLRVVAKGGNAINIVMKGKKDLEVPLITDGSKVELRYQQGKKWTKIHFSNGFSRHKGDLTTLSRIGVKVNGFCPGKQKKICHQTFGSVDQLCMNQDVYQAAQRARDLREKHLASITKTGVGKFYGSKWAVESKKKLAEKTLSLDNKMAKLKREIRKLKMELRDISLGLKSGDKGDIKFKLEDKEYNLKLLQEDKKKLKEELTVPKGVRSIHCSSYVTRVVKGLPAKLRGNFVKKSKHSLVYGIEELKKKGWVVIALSRDTKKLDPKFRKFEKLNRVHPLKGKKWEDLNSKEFQKEWRKLKSKERREVSNYEKRYTPLRKVMQGGKNFQGGGIQGPFRIPVDITIKNYKKDTQAKRSLELVKQFQYFVGASGTGYHTYQGSAGKVQEVHYRKGPKDKLTIDETTIENFGWDGMVIAVPKVEFNRAKKIFCKKYPKEKIC